MEDQGNLFKHRNLNKNMVDPQIKPAGYEQFIEQKITQQVTINAGATGVVSVTVPTNGKAFLKGYGYTWFATNTYTLRAGSFVLPSRTDQEGSTSIPVIYGNPFPVNSGEKMELTILNGSAAAHTYDVVFYIITNRIIPTNSTGGEMILSTGSGAGSGGNIAIYDASFATNANVTAKGLQVDSQSPATLLCGTLTTASGTATALASSTACQKVDVQVDSASGDNVLIGNATSQLILLAPSQSISITIDNLSKIYIKRPSTTNVTVNYIGS
jgi:hypothetical protein